MSKRTVPTAEHYHREEPCDCEPQLGEPIVTDEDDAVWAHAFVDTETEEPHLLTDEELAEVNEAIDPIAGRWFISRVWIRPGPVFDVKGER